MATNILTSGRVTWIDLHQPVETDIQEVSARYPQIHPLNLQDFLTEQEMPKLDHQDDYLFLVVQFPVWESRDQIPQPAELDIFIARGTLVTGHHHAVPALDRLFNLARDEQARPEILGHGASPLLYRLLDELVDDCFPLVHQLEHSLREVESRLFRSEARQMLQEIALLRRSVIALRHILYPQLDVVKSLERGSWPFIHEELDLYWSDISDHLSQLCDRIDEHGEVLAGLSDTVDTLASHKIDEVVRLLTVVTVLTLPLTLLATIFGMNVLLPYATHPLVFYTILTIGILLTLALILYLNKRKWL